MRKIILLLVVSSILLINSVSAVSFDNENFKNQILEQLKVYLLENFENHPQNYDITTAEKEEIIAFDIANFKTELDEKAKKWDLRNIIVNEIEQQLEYVEKVDLKSQLLEKAEKARTLTDGREFFKVTNGIYDSIFYSYNIDWNYDDDFNFENEKKHIIISLWEEIISLKDEIFKKEVSKDYEEIKNINNEEQFFESLDDIYYKIDTHYEKNWYISYDFSFEEEREDIISSLWEEIGSLKDETFKKEVSKDYETIKNINDEEEFFDNLYEIYDKLDMHYYDSLPAKNFWDTNKVKVEIYDYDYETEKINILKSLEKEISPISNGEFKKEVLKDLESLRNMNEEEFFKNLQKLYIKLDNHYEY